VASSLFSRKPIAALVAEGENPKGLRRVLGAGDLIMLAIGAVIGAGIFSSIGTAAAGAQQTRASTTFDPAGASIAQLRAALDSGAISEEQLVQLLKLARKGIGELVELQKQVLA